MKARAIAAALSLAAALASCDALAIGTGLRGNARLGRVVDHRAATVEGLTAKRIARAKEDLVIAYWHTSHGSQLITGNDGMDAFYGGKGWYAYASSDAVVPGALALIENGTDLGNPGLAEFEADVRAYLPAHPNTNVVIASWCGQVSGAGEEMIREYLDRMSALEASFPSVAFVYMTGHSDGSGDGSDGHEAGNLHLRDRQIRAYCEERGKWLFDFYDIECYDPDGIYYGDRYVADDCDYDANRDGEISHRQVGSGEDAVWVVDYPDRNWAIDWQEARAGQWWDCGSAHSQPLNANQKAKAAWQLWCAIAETR